MRLRLLAFLLLAPALLTGCGGAAEPEAPPDVEATDADALPEGDGTRDNPYVGRGTIEQIGEGELVIEHGVIPGWMAPMTMAFPVTGDVDLAGLAVGDEVMFSIELAGESGYQVFRIE